MTPSAVQRGSALLLLAAAPLAHALSLDFGEGPSAPTICSSTADGLGALVACANFGYLSQSYGDVAGTVDVTYSAPRLPGNSLEWWSTSYNTLYGVAFAPGGDSNSLARIELKPVKAGDVVTLSSLDLGAFGSGLSTTLNVYAIGGVTPLYSFNGPIAYGATVAPQSFSVNVSSASGLWIEWNDSAYNVGIDHIQYTVGAVPEPASVALMLAGLSVFGVRSLRRR